MQNTETWRKKRKATSKNQQRRVQTMQLYYNAAEKYKQPIPAETGARLKYDIKELRLRPEKVAQSYQKLELERETENPREAQQDWGDGKDIREH